MTRLVPALETTVRTLRASDPLLPIQVVVASHLLGAWLAPRLFAETGHFAIHFLELPELAWKVAAPRVLAEGFREQMDRYRAALSALTGEPVAAGDACRRRRVDKVDLVR